MRKTLQTAEDIRRFNRFYLPYFHLLTQKYLNSDYSTAEARILYEIYAHGTVQAREIVQRIHVDKSYLSRILKKFDARGLILQESVAEDSRLVAISLTAEGAALAEQLIDESNAQVEQGLLGLTEGELDRLSRCMEEIVQILGGEEHENR
jgi:DNA-binding MarR family transcriptional regulator